MRLLAALAVAGALASPVAALAAGPYGEAAEAIPFSEATAVPVTARGLDLNRPADAAAMLQRISSAALEACGASDFSIPDYRRAVAASDCYHQGVAGAVRQLNAPGLNSLYGEAGSTTLAAN